VEKTNKVEKFKLSKEDIEFAKQMEKWNKISQVLRDKIQIHYDQGQTLMQLLKQTENKKIELLKQAPPSLVKEIPGQDDED